MKKLTLDVSKWRCGANGSYMLGEGDTELLNSEGFMCCLGQFASQLNPIIKTEDLLFQGEPSDINYEIVDLNKKTGFINMGNTDLSNEAININDDDNTTVIEKIQLLKELFIKYNYEIEIVNL